MDGWHSNPQTGLESYKQPEEQAKMPSIAQVKMIIPHEAASDSYLKRTIDRECKGKGFFLGTNPEDDLVDAKGQ